MSTPKDARQTIAEALAPILWTGRFDDLPVTEMRTTLERWADAIAKALEEGGHIQAPAIHPLYPAIADALGIDMQELRLLVALDQKVPE